MNHFNDPYHDGYQAGRKSVFEEMRGQRTRLVREIRNHEEKLAKAVARHDALVSALDMFTNGELDA